MQWIPYAMVRVAAVFVAGVLLCIDQPGLFSESLLTVFLTIIPLVYFFLRIALVRSRSIKLVSGLLGLMLIFFSGYLSVLLRNESLRPEHLINVDQKIDCYKVKIISAADEREKSWRRRGEILAIRTRNGWRTAEGDVNLYWPKTESEIPSLDYGDILMVKGFPSDISGPGNPHEFDYKKFLAYRGIFHQHYVREGNWSLVEKSSERGILFYALRTRSWSIEAIRKFIPSAREQAIVIAFVIGVTDGIDNELRSAYAANGAMHVLAVSGLHVSIIYGIILFFLKPVGQSRHGPWIIAGISLLLLWTYAFVTGLPPSVLRAVTMFSFVAIAKPIGRYTNIYNTLAASAFCLLLYDPFLIMSVGFQLSYLAVAGIVVMQRPIYNLWETKYLLVDWAWQITCVSIAAQISTFAVSLLFFHQFPVYFLVANLFVIPGSFVILVVGILLLVVSPFQWVASCTGVCLEWFVRIFNDALFFMEDLPHSLINGIYISSLQCWLLLGLIVCGILLCKTRGFRWMLALFVLASSFSFLSWQHQDRIDGRSSFTVYRVQGHHAMDWVGQKRTLFSADSVLHTDRSAIEFHIEPNRLESGTVNTSLQSVRWKEAYGLKFLSWNDRSFLWINSKKFEWPEGLSVDYVLVSNNALESIQKLASHVNFTQLIFDSSNSLRYCTKLEKEANGSDKKCFFVLTQGAFSVNL